MGEGPLRPADPFWHGPVSALRKNLDDLATRYGKDVMIAEHQYAWTFADGDSTDNFSSDDPSRALLANTREYPVSAQGPGLDRQRHPPRASDGAGPPRRRATTAPGRRPTT